VLAVTTASLYAYGLSFYQGYLKYWGLEESLLELSFERLLFQGFMASGLSVVGALLPFALGSVLILVFAGFFGWLSERPKIKQWREKVQRGDRNDSYLAYLALPLPIVEGVYWVLVTFIVTFVLLAIATSKGQTIAENQKSGAFANAQNSVDVTLTTGQTFKGYSIICAEEHCAFFVEGEVVVYPKSSISSIRSRPLNKR